MEHPDQKFFRVNGKSPKDEAHSSARALGMVLIFVGLVLLAIAGLLTAYLR